jgi:hypothetical protein
MRVSQSRLLATTERDEHQGKTEDVGDRVRQETTATDAFDATA